MVKVVFMKLNVLLIKKVDEELIIEVGKCLTDLFCELELFKMERHLKESEDSL